MVTVYEAAGTDYSCLSIRRSSTWDTPRRPQSLAVPAFSMVGEGHLDLQACWALSTAGRGYGTCSGDVLVLGFYANGAQGGIEEPVDRLLTSAHLHHSTPSYLSLRLPSSIPLHPV